MRLVVLLCLVSFVSADILTTDKPTDTQTTDSLSTDTLVTHNISVDTLTVGILTTDIPINNKQIAEDVKPTDTLLPTEKTINYKQNLKNSDNNIISTDIKSIDTLISINSISNILKSNVLSTDKLTVPDNTKKTDRISTDISEKNESKSEKVVSERLTAVDTPVADALTQDHAPLALTDILTPGVSSNDECDQHPYCHLEEHTELHSDLPLRAGVEKNDAPLVIDLISSSIDKKVVVPEPEKVTPEPEKKTPEHHEIEKKHENKKQESDEYENYGDATLLEGEDLDPVFLTSTEELVGSTRTERRLDEDWNVGSGGAVQDLSDDEIEHGVPQHSPFRDLHLFGSHELVDSGEEEARESKEVHSTTGLDDDWSVEDEHSTGGAEDWTTDGRSTGAAVDDWVTDGRSTETDTDFDTTDEDVDGTESMEKITTFQPFKVHGEVLTQDLDQFTTREVPKRPSTSILSKLVFPPVPRGELYRVQALGLADGFFPFSFIGTLLSFIQPALYPIGLAKDYILGRLGLEDLVIQSLSSDAGTISTLTLCAMLAVLTPCVLIGVLCVAAVRHCRGTSCEEDNCSDSSATQGCGNCRRRGVVFAMLIILVLLTVGIAGVFLANEQVNAGTAQTHAVVEATLGDASRFVRNSHVQLQVVVRGAVDQAVQSAFTDLENVDSLLGRPIQRDIAAETGVDVALDLLMDVTTAAQSMAERCMALQQLAGSTRQIARTTQDRLAELRAQVDAVRRQCPGRDRPLCDTLDTAGMDVSVRLDKIMGDQRLAHLRKLRNDTLLVLAQQARGEFEYIPHQIDVKTRDARFAIRRELEQQRTNIHQNLRALDSLANQIESRLHDIRTRTLENTKVTPEIEDLRWIAGIVSGVALLTIWLFLLAAITCGCCGAENQASCALIVALVLVGLLSTTMWALAMAALVAGGQGELLVCRPLYEEPNFVAMTTLFDSPGGVYVRPGLFSNLGYRNDSLDVPIKTVLSECRNNRPAYTAFQLSRVFDAERAVDHQKWGNLHVEVSKLDTDLKKMLLLTPELQRQLQLLLDASRVDVAAIRTQLSGQVVSKDVTSLANQLESVSNQVRDQGTLNRLESLVKRTRRLISSNIQPLQHRKDDLVYQLTALEVQLVPLQKQVNQSLAHLKTIQYFISTKGSSIAQEKSRQFASRLVHYFEQVQDYVVDSVRSTVAPCRPVWQIFQAGRMQACKYLADPLNGLWLSLSWCLILLLVAIPTSLSLRSYYAQLQNSGIINRTTESQDSPPATWSTPNSGGESGDRW